MVSKGAANLLPILHLSECSINAVKQAKEHSTLRVLLFGTIIWKIAIDCGLHNSVEGEREHKGKLSLLFFEQHSSHFIFVAHTKVEAQQQCNNGQRDSSPRKKRSLIFPLLPSLSPFCSVHVDVLHSFFEDRMIVICNTHSGGRVQQSLVGLRRWGPLLHSVSLACYYFKDFLAHTLYSFLTVFSIPNWWYYVHGKGEKKNLATWRREKRLWEEKKSSLPWDQESAFSKFQEKCDFFSYSYVWLLR